MTEEAAEKLVSAFGLEQRTAGAKAQTLYLELFGGTGSPAPSRFHYLIGVFPQPVKSCPDTFRCATGVIEQAVRASFWRYLLLGQTEPSSVLKSRSVL